LILHLGGCLARVQRVLNPPVDLMPVIVVSANVGMPSVPNAHVLSLSGKCGIGVLGLFS